MNYYIGIGTRQRRAAYFMGDNTALENRPEAFNGLSMNCSALGVVHSGVREVFAEVLVAGPLARPHERQHCLCG